MQSITFQNAGYALAGHYFAPTEPKPLAFLLIQGWQGHENIAAAEALGDLGYPVLTYDMRGNGQSEGDINDFSRQDFVNDSVAAFDYLQNLVSPDVPIAVVGSSFGCYTAALLSEQRPVQALSLRVPANYPDEGFNEPQEAVRSNTDDFVEWRSKPLPYNENAALQAIHNFTGPVQIIEAEVDEMVSRQTVSNYKDAVSDPIKRSFHVMKNAPHRLATDELKNEYNKLLTDWAMTL